MHTKFLLKTLTVNSEYLEQLVVALHDHLHFAKPDSNELIDVACQVH